MRKATEADLNLVVDICVNSLNKATGVNWLFKNKTNAKKIERLATFAFYKCLQSNGVLISDNNSAALLYYKNNVKDNFKTKFYQLKFALLSIPILHLCNVIFRENTRKKIRPKTNFVYVFLFGAKNDGTRAGFELQKAFEKEIEKLNLDAYTETAMLRNKNIYERYGFKTYKHWQNKKRKIEFWFMKKKKD